MVQVQRRIKVSRKVLDACIAFECITDLPAYFDGMTLKQIQGWIRTNHGVRIGLITLENICIYRGVKYEMGS